MPVLTRRVLLTSALMGGVSLARADRVLTVRKAPGCECCDGWARHMRDAGFSVTVIEAEDLDRVRKDAGVPDEVAGCHTGRLGARVIEGHVPAEAVARLMSAPNDWAGIAAPGMPIGSPGMEIPGLDPEIFQIWAWRPGRPPVRFASARGVTLLAG